MSGRTITSTHTHTTTSTVSGASGHAAGPVSRRLPLALDRAARELDFKKGEFELAVHLGHVRTVPAGPGGGRRVNRAEIDRVRGEDGFPETLRRRVKAVATRDGAALMEVTPARFTRLGRLGLIVPVTWYLNRYRAVVWLYLAEELKEFAAEETNARSLTGRAPKGLRDQLEAGLDLRPRNWRGRYLGFQLRQTEDPWARAAVVASLLDPARVEDTVRDPGERAELHRLRPPSLVNGPPDSPAARIAARVTTAGDPDEIGWLVADLRQTVGEARRDRPLEGPVPVRDLRAPGSPITRHRDPARQESTPPRGVLGWLRRRGA
ncbi:DUF6397 family protein [Streptomyces sp. NPDC047022]|uniref:DUF6397 family protein n=1 Tax=Streptomyces sp. NPDC047022 TaxID=3155737 RepID=UPI0033E3CD3A